MQCNYNSFTQIKNFHGLCRNAQRCRKTGACRILVPLRYFHVVTFVWIHVHIKIKFSITINTFFSFFFFYNHDTFFFFFFGGGGGGSSSPVRKVTIHVSLCIIMGCQIKG